MAVNSQHKDQNDTGDEHQVDGD